MWRLRHIGVLLGQFSVHLLQTRVIGDLLAPRIDGSHNLIARTDRLGSVVCVAVVKQHEGDHQQHQEDQRAADPMEEAE
jgi:hypothetical protein